MKFDLALWHYLKTSPLWNTPEEVRFFVYRCKTARKSSTATKYAFPHAHLKVEKDIGDFCDEVLTRKWFRHVPQAVHTIFIRPSLDAVSPATLNRLAEALAVLEEPLTVTAPFDERSISAFESWSSIAGAIGSHISQLVLVGMYHEKDPVVSVKFIGRNSPRH